MTRRRLTTVPDVVPDEAAVRAALERIDAALRADERQAGRRLILLAAGTPLAAAITGDTLAGITVIVVDELPDGADVLVARTIPPPERPAP